MLEPIGWTDARPSGSPWPVSMAASSRVRSGRAFLGCHHEKMCRTVEGPAPGINGLGRVCRIHGRKIYRALCAEGHRRRITSQEVLIA